MDKSTLNKHKHREWWWLLLIPLTLVLLDSYGWFPQSPLPVSSHREATAYRITAEQAQPLSLSIPQTLSAEPVQGRLVHRSGDIHLLVTKNTGLHSVELQVPALPAGHYQMLITQGKKELLQERLHVLPRPALILDRYFVQAGDTLSLWRNNPTDTRYRISGFSEHSLTAQNPQLIPVPEDLPAGKHQLQVSGVGNLSFEVLGAPTPLVTVKPHHDLVLPGVDQSLYLHILDAQQRPLKQGWIRTHEKSYAINEGLAIVALPAKSVTSELLYTAGIAEGQIEQGTLQLQVAKAPWAIGLVPAQAVSTQAQQMQWIGPHREDLSWQAEQDYLSLNGKLLATAPLSALYKKLNTYFQSDRPVSLRFVDRQGRGQSMTLQFPPSRSSSFSIQPPQPHALSVVEVKSPATLLPWINHYLPGTYAWNNGAPALRNAPLEPEAPDWRFIWLLTGLLCSSIPWYRARQKTQGWQVTLEQSKRLKRARTGVLVGASLWLLSLPAAWLNEYFFMGQSYLLGLTLSSLSLIWALRKTAPGSPVWIFTQTALLLLCFWFNLTYWPAGQGFVILWSGVLCLGWISLFARWQRSTPLYNSRLVLAATLATLSILQGIVSFRSVTLAQATTQMPVTATVPPEYKEVVSHTHYPVALPQLVHSLTSPAAFSLTGQGGVHDVSGKDPQGRRYLQRLNVLETPRVQTQAPAIAQHNDLLQLPIRLTNPTPGTAILPLRLQGPQLSIRQTETLQAGENKVIYFPVHYHRSGINTYTLAQFYDGKWHAQDWQTYVKPTPSIPDQETDRVKFSPLRLQITYPEKSSQVGGEIPVVVDFQHRLPEDAALQLSIGIPAGFTAITDTLMTDKNKVWLADFRPSTSSLNIDTTVLRAGQRVRFHYRLKAVYAGEFQTPEAVLSSSAMGTQREFAQSTLLKVLP